MKLSDYVIDFLKEHTGGYLFEVCGGAIVHLLDSTHGRTEVKTISMHHEQAAAFAAEGFSRMSTKTGVAMATSGPGATNMITGIGSCFFDSVPCLFITGQVNTYEFKYESPLRQRGFQETDIARIVRPIVKDSVLITDASTIRYHLERAISLAYTGRPGPVLLDIPMDVQRAQVDPSQLTPYTPPRHEKNTVDEALLHTIAQDLAMSERPLILAGHGVRIAGAVDLLIALSERTATPVVTSLMGLDAFPHDHPQYAGLIGVYGNRYANLALAQCDLLLVLGARLDSRQTGTARQTFARGARVIRVDIDSAELMNTDIRTDTSVTADIADFLRAFTAHAHGPAQRPAWETYRRSCAERFPSSVKPKKKDAPIHPNYFIARLSEHLPKESVICADVGQTQIWAAQSAMITHDQRFLTQGGMGAMGSSLPLAIGAYFAAPERTIVVLSGDGGFQLNIQELETVAHHALPIKVFVFNNRCYGMVRQFQKQYFESRFTSTVHGYSCPDFTAVARAYGLPASRIESNAQIIPSLKRIFSSNGPELIEVAIDQEALVLPKLAVNKPLEEQDPELTADERAKYVPDRTGQRSGNNV